MSLDLIGTGSGYKIITTATTTNIKTTPGKVGQLLVWNVGAGATIDVYDDPVTSTNHVYSWATADGKGVFPLQCPMLNGITVVTAGGTPASLTVVYT